MLHMHSAVVGEVEKDAEAQSWQVAPAMLLLVVNTGMHNSHGGEESCILY